MLDRDATRPCSAQTQCGEARMIRSAEQARPARVALFVTCLGDGFYPEVGEATVRLLHRLGIAVDFPRGQTCYGQPAFNAGSRQLARAVARRSLILFANAEYIVVPSGACADMWWVFYPELFADDPV